MEDNKKDIEDVQNTQGDAPIERAGADEKPAAPPAPSGARILAKAGEAFDAAQARRELHESGLKDPAKVEPTDQSFIFAEPGEKRAAFADDDSALKPVAPAGAKANLEVLGVAQPALDLTEAPDPDIPWRARPLSPGAEPLPMGVLKDEDAPKCPRSIYDTDPGLFGPGDPWLFDSEEADAEGTELVLGVKFREYGSVYFFRAGKRKIKSGGRVLVETEQGLSMAEVISARRMRLPLPKIRTAEGEELEIKSILDPPGPEDVAADVDNKILASGARLFCKECIRERNLDMKLVDVEVLHDRSKIIFYFTAPTRIDFRDLVKDLVRNYRTRIELRQIGVRHETQMLGALGNCGMACCCRRYLRRFAPVTIKMAKEQNLFLNPAKLSGICGRLLCCLANEQENYEAFHRNCPKIGKKYQTTRGVMKVVRANLFRQSILTVGENGEEEEFQLDNWHALEPQRLETREFREPRPDGQAPERPEADEEAGLDSSATLGDEVSEADLAGLEDDSPASGRERSGQARPEHMRTEQPRQDRQRSDRRPHGQQRSEQHSEQRQENRPERRDHREQRPRREQPGSQPGAAPDSPAGSFGGGDNQESRDEQARRRDRGPRGKRGGQGRRPQPDEAGRNSQGVQGGPEGARPPRPQQSENHSEGRPEARPEERSEQRPEQRPDADKSIFGLPGSKYQK